MFGFVYPVQMQQGVSIDCAAWSVQRQKGFSLMSFCFPSCRFIMKQSRSTLKSSAEGCVCCTSFLVRTTLSFRPKEWWHFVFCPQPLKGQFELRPGDRLKVWIRYCVWLQLWWWMWERQKVKFWRSGQHLTDSYQIWIVTVKL